MNHNFFEKVSFEEYKKHTASPDPLREYNNIKLPKRATMFSAGYDFYTPVSIYIKPGETILIPTGIRAVLDYDKYLALYPRSGLGFKFGMGLSNTVGIIDADYSESDNGGHIMAKFVNNGTQPIVLNSGDAVMQGIITPYFVTYNDETTARRNGGFGSTDKKE